VRPHTTNGSNLISRAGDCPERLRMILGVYGYQDSGKTTMVEKVVEALVKAGLRVASVKHSTCTDAGDEVGKDSWRHAEAGSDPVVLLSPNGAILRTRAEMPVERLVKILSGSFAPDVVIIEGLKEGRHPKVSLGDIRPRKGTVMSNPTVKELVSYIETEVKVERALGSLPGLDCGKCGLDCESMARAIVGGKRAVQDCRDLPSRNIIITVGGTRIATGTFVSEIVDDTIRGMLGSLKGYEPGKDVEIRLGAPGPKAKGRRRKPA
jgi:molybdopterin-guanine dinucleotide biosynthesis adapter protein